MARLQISDEEWAIFEPFVVSEGGRPPSNHSCVLDGFFTGFALLGCLRIWVRFVHRA